jgi:hypothetical protein
MMPLLALSPTGVVIGVGANQHATSVAKLLHAGNCSLDGLAEVHALALKHPCPDGFGVAVAHHQEGSHGLFVVSSNEGVVK